MALNAQDGTGMSLEISMGNLHASKLSVLINAEESGNLPSEIC